jgi:hypothetical protein
MPMTAIQPTADVWNNRFKAVALNVRFLVRSQWPLATRCGHSPVAASFVHGA